MDAILDNQPDAINLLKADHRKVESLFKLIQQARTAQEKRKIFQDIRNELDVHTRAEETVFYPAFSQYRSFDDLLDDAYQEHQDMRDRVDELDETDDDDEFEDRLDDLIDDLEDHVHQEENVFFPKVHDVMDERELIRLGQMILDVKTGISRKVA